MEEFVTGLAKFLEGHEFTTFQLEALWGEVDKDKDGKVSLDDFQLRMCTVLPANAKKPNTAQPTGRAGSASRQGPRGNTAPGTSALTEEAMIEMFWMGFEHDQAKSKKTVEVKELKKYMTIGYAKEKEQAEKEKREPLPWVEAVKEFNEKDILAFVRQFEPDRAGKFPFPAFYEHAQEVWKAGAKKRKKKPRKPTDEELRKQKEYTMKTVRPEEVHEFVNEVLFQDEKSSMRCCPPLRSWPAERRREKGAALKDDKEGAPLFLSKHTKVHICILEPEWQGPIFYVSFFCQLTTGGTKFDWLHAARIHLNSSEQVIRLDKKELKAWADDVLDYEDTEDLWADWQVYVQEPLPTLPPPSPGL